MKNTLRVVTRSIAKKLGIQEDNYLAKLVKYIPAEIIAAYTALRAIANGGNTPEISLAEIDDDSKVLFSIIFFGCLILTPLYKLFVLNDNQLPPPIYQVIISTLAFIVWVFAFGDIFTLWMGDSYNSLLAGIVLIFFTLIAPIVENIFDR